jgi:hypothetical protein
VNDIEAKVASEIRAVLARHRVHEFALLQTLRSMPKEDAARLARELRACANGSAACHSTHQVELRPWSFLK